MPTILRSIQGEQQDDKQMTLWADDDAVAEFVAKATPGILACRERGRHLFRSVSQVGNQIFTKFDDEGRAVREEDCQCCEAVTRVQRWGFSGRRGHVRFELLVTNLIYKTLPGGVRGVGTPGMGRMRPKQISRVQIESLFGDMSPGEIKQHVLAQGAKS